MPFYIYTGDPNTDLDTESAGPQKVLMSYTRPDSPGFIPVTAEFRLNGAPVEVTHEGLIKKLDGNSHFTKVSEVGVPDGNADESGIAQQSAQAPGSIGGRGKSRRD